MSESMCKKPIKSKKALNSKGAPPFKKVFLLEMKSDLDQALEPEITIQIQKYCSQCNLYFDSTEEYDDHNTKHHQLLEPLKTTFQCNLCAITFARHYHLKRHIETKHPQYYNDSDESTQECHNLKSEIKKEQHECDDIKTESNEEQQRFNNCETGPKNELPVISKTLPKNFVCSLCTSSFARNEHLKRHLTAKHFNDSETNSKNELPVISEAQKKKFTCSLCMTSFARQEHLKRHIATKHTQYNKTECPFCSIIFKKKQLLLEHLAVIHSDQSFSCMLCLFHCSDYKDFEKHNLTHFKNVHTCPECNAIFKRRDHMLRHINSLHLKLFKLCSLCDLKFTRQDHLTKHLRDKHSKVMINNELVDL